MRRAEHDQSAGGDEDSRWNNAEFERVRMRTIRRWSKSAMNNSRRDAYNKRR
jgi:hypothetical protein